MCKIFLSNESTYFLEKAILLDVFNIKVFVDLCSIKTANFKKVTCS